MALHRPTLLVGLGVIVLMCLFPPFETGPVDDVTDALRGEEVSRVEYRPLWSRPDPKTDALFSSLREWDLAEPRLLLQFLAVILVTGGVAYTLESVGRALGSVGAERIFMRRSVAGGEEREGK